MVAFLTCQLHSRLPAQEANNRTTLGDRQASVAQRFQKLQDLLLRLAEMEAAENPERAALLRRAARQASDQFILEKLKTASDSLETEEFQKAVENQEAATKDLGSLLTLLMSEDRSERIRAEKDRVQQMVKDLKRTLNNQRSVRARTENGVDLEQLKSEQKSVTERGDALKNQMREDNDQIEPGESQENNRSESQDASSSESSKENETSDKPSESDESQGSEGSNEQSEDSSQDSPSKDKEPRDSEEGGENPPKGNEQEDSTPPNSENMETSEQQNSGSTESSSDKPENEQQGSKADGQSPTSDQDSQPQSEGDSGQSQSDPSSPSSNQQPPNSSSPPQPQTPEQQAQQQLEKAVEKMRQAEKALEDAKRDQAAEQQRAAEEDLREAIDELEKILRQLREEEMQRELARLEARLKKMATMQAKVLEDTITLASTPSSQRNRQTDLKAGELAFEEKKITLEADRALLLLREEGSSVAFPEVVRQIRDDTARVADLLNETKIDIISQGIQQDILAALEEMILALQKAQRDLEEQQRQEQQPPGSPPPSGQSEQPLVESIAELKLIRTMQLRIQGTTNRYADLIEEGQNTAQDLLPVLRELAERQDRLDQITRDIAMERNQ